MSRIGYPLLVAVVMLAGVSALVMSRTDPARQLAAAAKNLDYRPIEGRLAPPYPYKPYRRIHAAALPELPEVVSPFRGASAMHGARDAQRTVGAALLLRGRADDAYRTYVDLLRQDRDETDVLRLIQASDDAELLTDFSAAALARTGDQELLLAYEAADRAWQLSQSVEAAWNRAIAAHRIGMHAFAERAWRDILASHPGADWASEAEQRRVEAERRTNAAPPVALERFFYRELFERTIAGETIAGVVPGDRLASDTNTSVAALRTPEQRQRLLAGLNAYLRGYQAVERNEVAVAAEAYATADGELTALGVPLALLARDQLLRCNCVLRKPGCLEAIQAFAREVAANGHYPWLAARIVYAEGQTLYRQGRMYEAAQSLERALAEFERLGDVTAAAQMHVLLLNVYSAAGESELALRHYLHGLAFRTPPDLVDRRRHILEDGILFMLRHGYLATAELLLDELNTAAVTDAARVYRATLHGVAAYRRGDRRRAAESFQEAHTRLRGLPDATTRADLAFKLAIAESGAHVQPASSSISNLDAGIAAQSGAEHSIWLPPLLTERGAEFERANELDRAEADYRRAIDVLESREPRIDQTVLALGLAAPSESPFDRAIRLLLRQERVIEALAISERASALHISSLHARGAGVRDVFQPLRARGDAVAEARRALRNGEVAVAQSLLSDELVTWVITRDAVIAVRHPVRREDVVRAAEHLQDCRERACDDAIRMLSGAALHPWIDRIPRGATLLLQPAVELEAVPFAMLETPEREQLVLRNASATVPTLRALARAIEQDALRTGTGRAFFAAAANPGGELAALPRAVAEITSASRYHAGAILDPRATRAAFLEGSRAASQVHFAGHVVVDSDRPLFSALVFDRGELLYVHELDERSFAKTRLIVLSACDSGRTPRPAMSVANALLSQNVPSVVYTFRAVDDAVAEAFMVAFHRALGDGKSRAEALREAQLTLLRAHPQDPTTWAAFALAGAAGQLNESGEEKEEEQ